MLINEIGHSEVDISLVKKSIAGYYLLITRLSTGYPPLLAIVSLVL
jgi:hypothetical protein